MLSLEAWEGANDPWGGSLGRAGRESGRQEEGGMAVTIESNDDSLESRLSEKMKKKKKSAGVRINNGSHEREYWE